MRNDLRGALIRYMPQAVVEYLCTVTTLLLIDRLRHTHHDSPGFGCREAATSNLQSSDNTLDRPLQAQ